MKCPYCKEEVERFSQTCSVCGEKLPKVLSYIDCLKETISSPKAKAIIKKSAIVTAILVAIIVLIIAIIWGVRYSINEIESNKFTENGYRSVVRSDNYTYASHSHADLDQMTDRILKLLNEISTEEKDLMIFFKKSKNKEDNVKLFDIFMTNLDKFREDAEIIYNNSSTSFESLGIVISEPVRIYQFKPIAIIKPSISSFYLITENSQADGYVFFRYDYKYMLDNYAPYLSDDWKDYFTLEIEYDKDFLAIDWESQKAATLAHKWSKKWGAFVEKYPNFKYSSELGEAAYELSSY